jgi:hypothetical protein
MGMLVSVFRWSLGDCSNNGVSAVNDNLCVVNVPGPFEPNEKHPAVVLEAGPFGGPVLRPVYEHQPTGVLMFGGSYAATSDSRWNDAVRNLIMKTIHCSIHASYALPTAVPIHDRIEDPAQMLKPVRRRQLPHQTDNVSAKTLFWGVAGASADHWSWYHRFDCDWEAYTITTTMENGQGDVVTKTLTVDDLRRAIDVLVDSYPNAVGGEIAYFCRSDEDFDFDAGLADAVLQQAVLGDIVFG